MWVLLFIFLIYSWLDLRSLNLSELRILSGIRYRLEFILLLSINWSIVIVSSLSVISLLPISIVYLLGLSKIALILLKLRLPTWVRLSIVLIRWRFILAVLVSLECWNISIIFWGSCWLKWIYIVIYMILL